MITLSRSYNDKIIEYSGSVDRYEDLVAKNESLDNNSIHSVQRHQRILEEVAKSALQSTLDQVMNNSGYTEKQIYWAIQPECDSHCYTLFHAGQRVTHRRYRHEADPQ